MKTGEARVGLGGMMFIEAGWWGLFSVPFSDSFLEWVGLMLAYLAATIMFIVTLYMFAFKAGKDQNG
jgi:hypothetical protein